MAVTLLRHATQKPLLGIIKPDIDNPLTPSSAWLFNEMNGISVLDIGAGLSSPVSGTVAWESTPYGAALKFDGTTTKVLNSATPALAANVQPFTIITLVKAASTSAGSHNVFAAGNGTLYSHQIRRDAAAWNLYVFNGIDANATYAAGVVAGAWQWVAATGDGANIKLFTDGVLRQSTATGLNTRSGSVVSIGYDGADTAGTQLWDGSIALVYVYKRALAQAEILAVQSEPYSMWQTRPLQVWVAGAVGHRASQAATVAEAATIAAAVSASQAQTLGDATAAAVALAASSAATVSEQVSAAVATAAQGSSVFTEQLALALATNDSQTLTELASIAVAFSRADAATLSEAASVASSGGSTPVSASDSATLGDVTAGAATFDTGVFDAGLFNSSDANVVIGLGAAESAGVGETVGFRVGATEGATLAEGAAVGVSATEAVTATDLTGSSGLFDTGVFDDGVFGGGASNVAIGVVGAESGAVTETGTIPPGVPISGADLVSLLDQAVISVSPAVNTAALAEAVAVFATPAATDQATVAEQVAMALASSEGAGMAERAALALVFGDHAALADIIAVSAAIAAVEGATLAERVDIAARAGFVNVADTEPISLAESASIFVLPAPPNPYVVIDMPPVGVATAGESPINPLLVVGDLIDTPPLVGSAH